jgi:phosphoribosylglycinamide formyltransferase-1
MVSGGGTNLQALIDACAEGKINGAIVAVISSNAETYALARAARAGIPTHVVSRKDCSDIAERDAKLIKILAGCDIDYVILAGYLGIFGADFIKAYPRKIINIHPALLPRHGGIGMYGINVHRAVIAAGDTVTGATAHYVNETVDGGEIIRQVRLGVLPTDTPETLQQRLLDSVEHKLLTEVVAELCAE